MASNGARIGIASLLGVLIAAPFVAREEGIVLVSYQDPVGIATACVGETDKAVVMHAHFTRDECVAVLGASLMQHAQRMEQCIHAPLTAGEAAAVLSWSYNVGTGAACSSTLVRKLNAGAEPMEWCAELSKWTRAGGRVLPGLVARRARERALCEGRR